MSLQQVVLGIVIKDKGVLLVRRTKQDIGKDGQILTWGFPGGKIEAGESNESAVIREVYEETGYRVSVERFLSERIHPDFPVKASYLLCNCLTNQADIVTDQGTSEIRWVPASEVSSFMTSPLDTTVESVLKRSSSEVLSKKL